jgi:hypothetical protein
VVTQAINKAPGPFAGGVQPSEVDCKSASVLLLSCSFPSFIVSVGVKELADLPDHIITYLARVITCTGVEPGSDAATALPVLQKWTGGHEFDPALAKYWE